MRELIDSLPFEIEARVPIQLGRESISSSVVAISELVKNAYDADATDVKVEFRDLGGSDATIVLHDNGSGMNYSDLTDYWLRIGTDFKTTTNRSPGRRILTGAKGLGRLGADRLCRQLTLQTKKKGESQFLELEVDWTQYEKKGKPLSEIKHCIYRCPVMDGGKVGETFPTDQDHGTWLTMRGLKDDWSREFLTRLQHELSLLVSPFGELDDFSIELSTGVEELDGKLSSREILDTAEWKLSAEVSAKQQVMLIISSEKYGETHREGPFAWHDWLRDTTLFPGAFSAKLFYMPEYPDALKQLEFRKTEWLKFRRMQSGMRIYRDHFRVRPYGDSSSGRGDWLNLAVRKTSNPAQITRASWVVAPLQIVGAVFIGRETNPGLIDQTNREGIVEEQPFFELRRAVMKMLECFEQRIHENAKARKPEKPRESAKSDLDSARKKIRESLRSIRGTSSLQEQGIPSTTAIAELLSTLERDVDSLDVAVETAHAAAEEEIRELETDKDTMANLASLGILTVCFGHEAKEYANLAAANAVLLKRHYDSGHLELMPPYDTRFEKSIAIIRKSIDFVKDFSGFALSNVRPDKRRRKQADLAKSINEVFRVMGQSLERQNISVDLAGVGKNVPKVRAFEIDCESILVNLLTNSIHALTDTPAAQRLIALGLEMRDGKVVLSFRDTGCGIEAGTADQIFKPMFSTRRDREGNVEGTGMGLAIVKTFVEEHAGGSIEVVSPNAAGQTEFLLEFPVALPRKEKP